MAVTLESLRAAGLANTLLLTTLVKSLNAPGIKAAFQSNARLVREIGLATTETDEFLAEFDNAVAQILREI